MNIAEEMKSRPNPGYVLINRCRTALCSPGDHILMQAGHCRWDVGAKNVYRAQRFQHCLHFPIIDFANSLHGRAHPPTNETEYESIDLKTLTMDVSKTRRQRGDQLIRPIDVPVDHVATSTF
jgi:hypothetical protein